MYKFNICGSLNVGWGEKQAICSEKLQRPFIIIIFSFWPNDKTTDKIWANNPFNEMQPF